MVNWLDVCEDKKHEWLQLRRLEGLNQALPSKWLWRFTIKRERKSFWREIILRNFAEMESGWTTNGDAIGRFNLEDLSNLGV